MSRLTTRQRDKLPKKDFGFPRERSYPLENKSHARAALARGKHNLSHRRYIELAKRVKDRFPSMHVTAIDGPRRK